MPLPFLFLFFPFCPFIATLEATPICPRKKPYQLPHHILQAIISASGCFGWYTVLQKDKFPDNFTWWSPQRESSGAAEPVYQPESLPDADG